MPTESWRQEDSISFELTVTADLKYKTNLAQKKMELDFVDRGQLADFKLLDKEKSESHVTINRRSPTVANKMLVQWPGSVSSLLSVSLFKFITWDRSQLVGLNISLRCIFKPSYSGHCTSTNVMHNAAGQMRYFELWHFCLPHFPARHQSKQKSQNI